MITYQLFPELSQEERDQLAASIREKGVIVPIIVDENGTIIDGHHRKAIADALGIDCPTDVRRGLPDHEKRLLAFDLNTNRRHLTDAQKIMVGQRIEPDIAEHAHLRGLANLKRGTASPDVTNDAPGETAKRTTDDIAARVGVSSGRTYERGKQTLNRALRLRPDLGPKVERGELTMKDLRQTVAKAAPAKPTKNRGTRLPQPKSTKTWAERLGATSPEPTKNWAERLGVTTPVPPEPARDEDDLDTAILNVEHNIAHAVASMARLRSDFDNETLLRAFTVRPTLGDRWRNLDGPLTGLHRALAAITPDLSKEWHERYWNVAPTPVEATTSEEAS